MKKILLSLAALAISAAAASAQEAFKHLSLGVEVGTTGAGVELALPVISNHLVLKAGYNLPKLNTEVHQHVDMSSVNDEISSINAKLASSGVPERINTTFTNLDMSIAPSISLDAAKLLLEFYPSKKGSFHFVFGAYMGMSEDFASVDVDTDATFWSKYSALKGEVAELDRTYGCGTLTDPKFNVGNNTYQIMEKDGKGHVGASLAVAKLRPYFGLGFGRSIPGSRLGVQFEVGAWMHGKPAITSGNIVNYDASAETLIEQDMLDLMDMVTFYPKISFSLVYRIF